MTHEYRYLISYVEDEVVCLTIYTSRAFLSAPIQTDEDIKNLEALIANGRSEFKIKILNFSLMQTSVVENLNIRVENEKRVGKTCG